MHFFRKLNETDLEKQSTEKETKQQSILDEIDTCIAKLSHKKNITYCSQVTLTALVSLMTVSLIPICILLCAKQINALDDNDQQLTDIKTAWDQNIIPSQGQPCAYLGDIKNQTDLLTSENLCKSSHGNTLSWDIKCFELLKAYCAGIENRQATHDSLMLTMVFSITIFTALLACTFSLGQYASEVKRGKPLSDSLSSEDLHTIKKLCDKLSLPIADPTLSTLIQQLKDKRNEIVLLRSKRAAFLLGKSEKSIGSDIHRFFSNGASRDVVKLIFDYAELMPKTTSKSI